MKKILRFIPFVLLLIAVSGCALSEQEEQQRELMETQTKNYMKDFVAKNYKNAEIKEVRAVTYIDQLDKELSDFVEVTLKIKGKNKRIYYNHKESAVYTYDNVDKIKEQLVDKVYTLTGLDKATFENVEVSNTQAKSDTHIELLRYDINTLDKLIEQSNEKAGYTLDISLTYKNSNINCKKLELTNLFKSINHLELSIYDVNNNFKKKENDIDDSINEFSDYTQYTLNSVGHFKCLENQIHLDYNKYVAKTIGGVTLVYNPDYFNVKMEETSKINKKPVVSYDDTEYKSLNKGVKLRFELLKPLSSLEIDNSNQSNIKSDINGMVIHENIWYPYIYLDKTHYKEHVNLVEEEIIWKVNNYDTSDNGHILILNSSEFNDSRYDETIAFYKEIEQ